MKDLCTRGRSAINLLLLIAIFQIWILVPIEGSEAEINSEVTTLREVFSGKALYPADRDGPPRPWSPAVSAFKDNIDVNHIADLPAAYIVHIGDADVQAAIESNGKNPEGAPPGESRVLMTLSVPYSVTPAGLAYGKAVLNRLKALIDASGVNLEYATMGDVERRFMRVVELPVIKQKVNVTNASWVLQLVLLAPLSLLLVVVESLWMIVREKPQKEIESLDLIFFYPSISAYVLGILWLIAPVLLITIGMRHFFTEAHTTLQNWIAAMAAAAILATIGIVWKRVHQIRRKTYDVAPESATATEQEEEEDEDDDAI